MSAQRRRKGKGPAQQSSGGGNQRRQGRGSKAVEPAQQFWGDAGKVPRLEGRVRISSEPDAVVRSLGRAPLSGQAAVAELYFTAVYDRAVGLATALAAASDLIELDDV
jgi:hypothetical protein